MHLGLGSEFGTFRRKVNKTKTKSMKALIGAHRRDGFCKDENKGFVANGG